MKYSDQLNKRLQRRRQGLANLALHPLALALALGGAGQALAGPALNAAWIGQQQAARPGATGNGSLPGHQATLAAQQVQKLNEQARLSIANLGQVAQAAAQAAEAQRIAREYALKHGLTVPDGLADGGLKIDSDPATAGWSGAEGPRQTLDTATGKVRVDIKQTESKAILNWETFNVGKNTHVAFEQQADWAVLNRVNDPQARPSQIQGQVSGDGTVMIINRNGVIFSGSSQVNTGNLVAAAANISDGQFAQGLYGTGNTATLTEAGGKVVVEAGGQIATHGKSSVLAGGGYVLLAGSEVENHGRIDAADGQATLAAGDTFYIRKGYGSEENQASTTRGNEVAARRNAGSGAGKVSNSGVIQAARGDVTLTGHEVRQEGVVLSSSSVHTRGTVHLLNSASDGSGSVTLGQGSVTAVLVEDSSATALDAQRDALIDESREQDGKRNNTGNFDNLGNMADRKDQSRVEIVSGGKVLFEGGANGSLTLASGGQIAVDARQRVFLEDGARLDASGATAVKVAMEKNGLKVNIQGYEQRDAPANRDTKELNNANVWVDVRDLILVPAGTNGYETDRYYTQGGLLEVAGYLGNQGSTAAERAAVGGSIRLGGAEVIAQSGSEINLAGGSLVYQDGVVQTSWLEGYDGKLYELTSAPADMPYKGVYQGSAVSHQRWGVTNSYYNLLLAPTQRRATGYVVGRDAGSLIIDSPSVVLEGTLHSGVLQGEQQTTGRYPGIDDGYKLPGNSVAQGGKLILNGDTPRLVDVRIGAIESISAGLAHDAALDPGRVGTAWLDSGWLSNAQLGGVELTTRGKLTVDGTLEVNPGGEIALYGGEVELTDNASLVARSGTVTVQDHKLATHSVPTYLWAKDNWMYQTANTPLNPRFLESCVAYKLCRAADYYIGESTQYTDSVLEQDAGALQRGGIYLAAGASIDTRGLWVNASQTAADAALLPYLDGGAVNLSAGRGLRLEQGSLIDASAGGAVVERDGQRRLLGGQGGDIGLEVNHNLRQTQIHHLDLLGTVRSLGTQRGGELRIAGLDSLLIGDGVQARHAGEWLLGTDFFRQGFSNYDISTLFGVEVAEDTRLEVLQPVLRARSGALDLASGTDLEQVYQLLLPELFEADAANASLTQRGGAGLSLSARPISEGNLLARDRLDQLGSDGKPLYDGKTFAPVTVGKGASIILDPGQRMYLEAWGQITIDGSITSHGGQIGIVNSQPQRLVKFKAEDGYGLDPEGLSVWIGEQARLDVSGLAASALDSKGARYGLVRDGGQVFLGYHPDDSGRNTATALWNSSHAMVVVREGAQIDASGAQLRVDGPHGDTLLASSGGRISLNSYSGLFVDGQLKAHAGGAGASGGTLDYIFQNPFFSSGDGPEGVFWGINKVLEVLHSRRIVIGAEEQPGALLPSDLRAGEDSVAFGRKDAEHMLEARLSKGQIEAGGFDSLNVRAEYSDIYLEGGLELSLGHSLSLDADTIHIVGNGQQVRLAAPYLLLDGAGKVQSNNYGMLRGGRELPTEDWQRGNQLLLDSHHLDVYDAVRFDRSIEHTHIRVDGDVRFLGVRQSDYSKGGLPGDVGLNASNDLTIDARQIYPASGVSASLIAGLTGYGTPDAWFRNQGDLFINAYGSNSPWRFKTDDPRVLRIGRIGEDTPATPYSVFGSLTLWADTVIQGGVLRAPLGSIVVADPSGALAMGKGPCLNCEFLPGSLTSISAAGLWMPYGGTPDGLNWYYNGATHKPGSSVTSSQITLGGTVHEGALIDVSGGGELAGIGFMSGRGGSTDVLTHPLMGFGEDGYAALVGGAGQGQVYAIVPGSQQRYAPVPEQAWRAGAPALGQQITFSEPVGGLPAGTYTLLPANYALLPGAFRVELGAQGLGQAAQRLANGSWLASGTLSIAHTEIRSSLANQVLVTSADMVRRHAEYNETSYSGFIEALARQDQTALGWRPEDAKTLNLKVGSHDKTISLLGDVRMAVEGDGRKGLVTLSGASGALEIRAAGSAASAGMVSLVDSDISRIAREASTILVGGSMSASASGSASITPDQASLVMRSGTTLRAANVLLASRSQEGVVVEADAVIDSRGQGLGGWGGANGISLAVNSSAAGSILAVSNDRLGFSGMPSADDLGGIHIGDRATLYSEGGVVFASVSDLHLGEDVRLGARSLAVALPTVHIGSAEALAQANLRPGWSLDSEFLNRLFQGQPEDDVPALESVQFNSEQSINFIGSVALDTRSLEAGRPGVQLVFNTPALYGWGAAGDVATLKVDNLVWNGVRAGDGVLPGMKQLSGGSLTEGQGTPYYSATPLPVLENGAGSGHGTLNIDVGQLTLGYADGVAGQDQVSLDRLILGFATVNLSAERGISANHAGSLSVYQTQENTYSQGEGFRYLGGQLNIRTPRLTSASGAVQAITAGERLSITSLAGGELPAAPLLGGRLSLNAGQGGVRVDSEILLPSGQLWIKTPGDVVFGDSSRIDLAGGSVTVDDMRRDASGGTLVVESGNGSIVQQAGGLIDVSAADNNAGSVLLTATGAGARIELGGLLRGAAGAGHAGGSLKLRGHALDDLAGLNARLNQGGFFGARHFTSKTGDILIDGDWLRGRDIQVNADGGSLLLRGRIDASGAKPGSIRLAARDDLVVDAGAVLDASSDTLQVDSYGQVIEASNRAVVTLSAGESGSLSLHRDALIDLRSADGQARGTLDLNVARLAGDDLALRLTDGAPRIEGAASIALNAVRRYSPTDGVVTQARLDQYHLDSQAFIAAATLNPALRGRLDAFASHGEAFHLRPAVEINSAATSDGNLKVLGDLDLSGYRYGSAAGNPDNAAERGRGEPGVLSLRAENDLKVHGSITDGFGLPMATPDDNGWFVPRQTQQDFRALVDMTLQPGTSFTPNDVVLEYDLPIREGYICPGCEMPVAVTLASALRIGKGEVLRADIHASDGTLLGRRGEVLVDGLLVPAGARLGAGSVIMSNQVHIGPLTWPAGTSLAALGGRSGTTERQMVGITLAEAVVIKQGQLIPAGAQLNVEGVRGSYTYPIVLDKTTTLPSGTVFSVPAQQVGNPDFEWRVPFDYAIVRDVPAHPANVPLGEDLLVKTSMRIMQSPYVFQGDVYRADGSLLYRAGQAIGYPTLPVGAVLKAGNVFPMALTGLGERVVLPAGVDLYANGVPRSQTTIALGESLTLAAGTTLPAYTSGWNSFLGDTPSRLPGSDGNQGRLWAVAPMLSEGTRSWSINLVAGSDLDSSSIFSLRTTDELAGKGNVLLSDAHLTQVKVDGVNESAFSVIRTGTGDLNILAGGDFSQDSLYGIYTAGTQAASISSAHQPGRAPLADGTLLGAGGGSLDKTAYNAIAAAQQAYYPEAGGNLLLSAQGDLKGLVNHSMDRTGSDGRGSSVNPGQWLWRAGNGSDQASAWWINFGTYGLPLNDSGVGVIAASTRPSLIGFMGIGTLGGGALTLEAGGDAGLISILGDEAGRHNTKGGSYSQHLRKWSTALNLAVGASGRIEADGTLLQTGGGDLSLRVLGSLNGSERAGMSNSLPSVLGTDNPTVFNGALTNVRGAIQVDAGAIGSPAANGYGRLQLVLGDSYATLNSVGPLALGLVQDAGRVAVQNTVANSAGAQLSWFSLWTAESGISLFSGGDLLPFLPVTRALDATNTANWTGKATDALYGVHLYPGTFKAYSGGDVLLGGGLARTQDKTLVELAPAANGQLELLAGGSIVNGSSATSNTTLLMSGAPLSILATPWRPGMLTLRASGNNYAVAGSNYWELNTRAYNALFNFGLDTYYNDPANGALHQDDRQPMRIYAGENIQNLLFGHFGTLAVRPLGQTANVNMMRYVAAKPALIRADQDITNLGTVSTRSSAQALAEVVDGGGILLAHNGAADVSSISAGRDIRYANAYVAGPGSLVVSAGRHVDQRAQGVLKSLGVIGDQAGASLTGGADIAVLAGVGEQGLDYAGFAARYLDPRNQADPDYPLSHEVNAGKVAKTYEAELLAWLQVRFGFQGSADQALALFGALHASQQGVFARQVYFQELQASGREYNDPDSLRYHTYSRGRQAIEALFPALPERSGDVTLYSAMVTSAAQGDAGIHTKFGGDIQVLAPYGSATFGLPNSPIRPGQNTGVVTHGEGDVRMYSQGNIVLGESRIFTTFGGEVQLWSDRGDINGGRGAKGTIVYAPARRLYDLYGNVTLSPVVPTSGAGIATLAPIPEVPPGDMDLVAPEGVIDPGEAGIRVSGNLNVAALRVVNVENIQVEGEAVGLPPVLTVDTGALSDGSRAAAAAVEQVQQLTRQRVQAAPRIDVDVLGFGGLACDPSDPAAEDCDAD